MEELKNASQAWQHDGKSQWHVHARGLWTHVTDNKNKHCKNKKRLLMIGYRGLDISGKKMKMKMKTTIWFLWQAE